LAIPRRYMARSVTRTDEFWMSREAFGNSFVEACAIHQCA
jgi:hypothetical protein